MKNKLFAVVLMAASLLSLSSCSNKALQNNKASSPTHLSTETPLINTPSVSEIEYTFLYDESFMMNVDTPPIVPNGFVMAKEHGFFGKEITKEFDDLIGTQKKIEGNTLTYTASDCTTKDASAKEIGDFYCTYDCYKNDSGYITAEYLHGTDMLVYYSLTRETEPDSGNSGIGKNKARDIADEFLLNIISQETLDKYTYYEADTNVFGKVSVTYVKYVHGYFTDDIVTVTIDADGVVTGYNARNLCKYDCVEEKITKEQLEAAHAALKDAIMATELQDVEGGTHCSLTADTTGKLYLRGEMWFIISDTDLYRGAEVFVNVN